MQLREKIEECFVLTRQEFIQETVGATAATLLAQVILCNCMQK